jgi:hypothetical protein
MYNRILAVLLSVSMMMGPAGWGMADAKAQTPAPQASTPDEEVMDKLLAPIALYPDALLAQVLACAASPEQITEVNKWLTENSQLQGTELQEAAETAGFDASFIALVLFPDVLTFLEQNLEWAKEVGNAFSSDQKLVLDSVQRLRAQAQAAGNLKTSAEQEVTTETQNGQTVIVVQPANPQVVYVPQYSPQTVYVQSPPPEDNSGDVAAAAVIGFALGVALGSAMDDDYGYYGYSSWGMHWNSHAVVVHGGHYHAPHGHYPYAAPRAGYRPPTNINAPRYNNINVNVDNRRSVNNPARTPRPSTVSASSRRVARPSTASGASRQSGRPSTQSTASRQAGRSTTSAGRTARSQPAGNAQRGRSQSTSGMKSSSARQVERGSRTSAFSGYQKGNREKAASKRGRSSSGSKSGKGRRGR